MTKLNLSCKTQVEIFYYSELSGMLHSQKIKISLLAYLFLLVNTTILLACKAQDQNIKNLPNNSITSFITPSGNIYCALIGEKKNILRCEIQSMLNPLPPQPHLGYCEFDWGSGFLLRQQGKPEILCISDTIGRSKHKLSYGETWINSGFKCVSKQTQLMCNNFNGHGFFLSRNKWNVF
ncbi:DUF6636 domain-containing protein [Nostoc sp.]|uniref:DUF6636 domain-containing protein n=1 Tax=Nostoc sp. TaxID=1180 RepID=UPI002FFBBA0A